MRAPSTEDCLRSTPQSLAPLIPSDRPTRAIVDLGALEHNFMEMRRRAGGRQVLAVVKAGAYGHGAVAVAKRLKQLGAEMLAVALVEEARELRDAGIDGPILVMGALFPDQAERIVELRITPVVYSDALAQRLSRAAVNRNTTIDVHVKIDTGMGRIGLTPDEAGMFIPALHQLSGIRIEGIMTHFAEADLQDKQFAGRQLDRFEALLRSLEEKKISIPVRHAANSAAVLALERALFTAVRPGLMLYGYDPLERSARGAGLRPVLSLVTRIAFIKKVPAGTPISYGRTFVTQRESIIATLAIGYADGYSRGLSNRGAVVVRGMRAPIAGRVCMDMCMADVTDIPGVCVGDDAVLIGSQGGEAITADDIALQTGTIAYEVLCGISSRVPRIYH